MSKADLLMQAKSLAKGFGYADFKASCGWLRCFTRRTLAKGWAVNDIVGLLHQDLASAKVSVFLQCPACHIASSLLFYASCKVIALQRLHMETT